MGVTTGQDGTEHAHAACPPGSGSLSSGRAEPRTNLLAETGWRTDSSSNTGLNGWGRRILNSLVNWTVLKDRPGRTAGWVVDAQTADGQPWHTQDLSPLNRQIHGTVLMVEQRVLRVCATHLASGRNLPNRRSSEQRVLYATDGANRIARANRGWNRRDNGYRTSWAVTLGTDMPVTVGDLHLRSCVLLCDYVRFSRYPNDSNLTGTEQRRYSGRVACFNSVGGVPPRATVNKWVRRFWNERREQIR